MLYNWLIKTQRTTIEAHRMVENIPRTTIPTPTGDAAWQTLQRWVKTQDLMAALESIHKSLGDVFQLPLPGFNAVMLVGPEANRFVLVEERDELRWRAERDPVTRLLRHG